MVDMTGRDEARDALTRQLTPGEIVVAGPVPVERSIRFFSFVWVVAWLVPRHFYPRCWLGVGDRRVILLNATWLSCRPKNVELAESRADVQVREAQVGLRRGIIFMEPDGHKGRLFFQRAAKFRPEISEVRRELLSAAAGDQVRTPASAATAAAPVESAVGEKVTGLKQLAELKDQGILTDEEFAAEKAKLLGG
jgi:hypothetical protein